MKLKLFPYQIEGAKWLSKVRVGCLFDEMGLGKSAQAITASELSNARTILVICRAVAIRNWRNEFAKFSKSAPTVTVTSYESLHKIDAAKKFDVVIVDESHYVKEPNANRTRAVLGKTGAIHRGKQAFLLTGTPTPNHAGEMWTTLYTLGRTRLSYDQFLERYCTSRLTSYGRQITGTITEPDKIRELREMLEPICLRRTKEDVNLQLPPIIYQDLIVTPGKVPLKACRSFHRFCYPPYTLDELAKIIEKELGIVKGILNGAFTDEAMRALEASAKSIMTLRRYNSLQKLDSVVELVSEELRTKQYEKIVIFAIHRDTIVVLQSLLAEEFGAVLVFGGSKPARIDERIMKFQDPKSKCKIFIANIMAAGTSITLTAADQVLFVDQDFVPGNNHQAAARCHRIGQTRPVTVRFVALAESIDQHISQILRRKTSEIAALMSGIKSNASRLKNAKTVNELL